MRLHVDLGSHFVAMPTDRITQVDNDPPYGASSNITGDYLLPSVDGTAISVTAASYVLPVDGGDVSSQAFGQLLARFPQYHHVYFNPLLQVSDFTAIDWTMPITVMIADPLGNLLPNYFYPRFKSGLGSATTVMPMGTALLPRNLKVTPAAPGLMVTENIDLSAATAGIGADDFLVYWKVYRMADTDDVATIGIGTTAGFNDPAFKLAQEVDQENTISALMSIDDGQNWVPVYRLQQVAFCSKTTQIRLAFANLDSSTAIYLAHFAVLF